MKQNVGPADRYVRFILGVGFIMNIFILEPTRTGTYILLALAVLMFYTAYYRYCFLYSVFARIKSGKKKVSA